MARFLIDGEIVGREVDKTSKEDVCPADFQAFADSLGEGEEAEIWFNSLGGDVFAGLRICSLISQLRADGHASRAVVTSIAASIASVIACACDTLEMNSGSFLMLHLPWCVAQGNAIDLQREISTLEQCKKSMVQIYRTKFDLQDGEIVKLLEDETWIDTADIGGYNLKADVVRTPAVKIAAVVNKNFKNIPKELISMKEEEIKKEEKPLEETAEDVEEEKTPDGGPTAEGEGEGEGEGAAESESESEGEDGTSEDGQDDELEQLKTRVEELERENEELRKQLEAPVEDRVRGMQSTMAKQLNSQKAEYSAKIEEFENQLKAKVEELTRMKAEVTSLNEKLEKSAMELSEKTSALVEKTNALATLNAGVNKPSEAKPPMTKSQARQKLASMPLSQRAEFYKQNKDLIDG